MTRISKTLIASSFLSFVGLTACDPSEAGPDEQQLAEVELELAIEQQLEEHDDADLECSALPGPDEVLDESVDEVLAPCLEWTELGSELDLRGPEDEIPTSACNVWQESKFVVTNVACDGCNGCSLTLRYVRTCSACPPNVPTSCSPWVFSSSNCSWG